MARDDVKRAYDMALITLRNRYDVKGILAGKNHFSDLWARDCCFAAMGSLSIGDSDIVERSLNTLFSNISSDGQVPLRVGQKHFMLKYLFKMQGNNQPRYTEDKNVSLSVDNNPLSIIVASRCYLGSSNLGRAKKNYPIMKQIIDWQFSQDKDNDGLIEEGFYAGWADSLKKHGNVFYTNVLHYKSLVEMSKLAEALGNDDDSKLYGDLSESVRVRIQEKFWNGNYFIDWIDSRKREFFSTDGNMLAIIFGVADQKQGKQIMSFVRENKLNQKEGVRTNFPVYPDHHVYPLFRLINMKDYHNGMVWLWLGGIYAIALSTLGLKEEAEETIKNISTQIIKYNEVYEVYEDGKPVNRLFYKSEDGFAWTSGIFVWACHEVGMIS
ncbi:hypothetical protein HOH45_08030 [bacterium]|jgi:glycogen debranching enzyme|nr:hypothetical protein [bacterium]